MVNSSVLNRAPIWLTWSPAMMPWLALVIGIIVTGVATVFADGAEAARLAERFERRAHVVVQAIEHQLSLQNAALESLASALSDTPTHDAHIWRLPSPQASSPAGDGQRIIGFIPASDIASPQAQAANQSTSAGRAGELGWLTFALAKMHRPIGDHQAAATSALVAAGPYGPSRPAFVMLNAVWHDTRDAHVARSKTPSGYVFAAVDAAAFFEPALGEAPNGVKVMLYAGKDADPRALLYAGHGTDMRHTLPPANAAGMENVQRIRLGGQTWTVVTKASSDLWQPLRFGLAHWSALAGLTMSGLVFWGLRSGRRQSVQQRQMPVDAARMRQQHAESTVNFGNYEILVDRDTGRQETDWSSGLYRLLGVRAAAGPLANDDYIDTLVRPDDRTRVRALLLQVAREGGQAECEYTIERPDGSSACIYEWLQACAVSQRQTMIYGLRCDVTQRRHAEAERLVAAVRFQSLLDQLPGIPYLASLKRHSDTFYVSPKIELLLGFTPEEWSSDRNLRLRQLHPQDRDKVLRTFARARSQSTPFSLEYRVLHRDGSMRWLRDEGRVITDASHRPLFLQGVALDITDRKSAQRELQRAHERAQQMIANLDALREMAHRRLAKEMHDDLGQSLAALKLDVAALRRHLPLKHPPLETILGSIDSLTEAMICSIRRIIAELPPRDIEEHGLCKALQLLAANFEKRFGVACRIHAPANEAEPGGELALAIYRIVQEALNNVSRHAQASMVDIRFDCNSACASLCIRDDGRGIGENDMCKTGSFGLIGMRDRVLALDGDMEIGAGPQGGTVIRITVPLPAPASGAQADGATPAMNRRASQPKSGRRTG